jgi:hypothetical protein
MGRHRIQRGGAADDQDAALAAAFQTLTTDNQQTAPSRQFIDDAVMARSPRPQQQRKRGGYDTDRRQGDVPVPSRPDPILHASRAFQDATKQDEIATVMQRDLTNMVHKIRDAVQRSVGNIESAKKVSEINDVLVGFANEAMQIIIKLSSAFYNVIVQMRDLNRELDGLNRQLSDTALIGQVSRLEGRIRNNLVALRKEFEESVKKISTYAGPEVNNIVGQAVRSMAEAIDRSSDLSRVITAQQAAAAAPPRQ